MNELLQKMKAINEEIAKLEAKKANEKEEAGIKYLTDEIAAKTVEFASLETQVADKKASDKRDKFMEDMAKESGAVNTSKTDALHDVAAKVTNSNHNKEKDAQLRDKSAWNYLTDPRKDGGNFVLSEMGGVLAESIRGKNKGNEGVQAPRSLAAFLVPQPTGSDILGKFFRDRLATKYGVDEARDKADQMVDQYGAKASTDNVLSVDDPGVLSGGGSLFNDQFVPELYVQDRLRDSIPSRCFVKQDLGGSVLFPKLTSQSTAQPFGILTTWGNAGSADGEGKTITKDNPTFDQITIEPDRLAALSQVSLKELAVNRVGLEGQLAMMYRLGIDHEISLKILQGTGVRPFPEGINSGANIISGLNLVPREATNQVSYTDLNALQFGVTPGLETGGTYILSAGANGSMKFIAGLDDTNGRPVLRNETWIPGLGVIPSLAGQPFLQTTANTSNLGSRGDVIFGDFRTYGLVVGSVDIARSDEFAFDLGVATFRVITYVGGKSLDATAFAVLADPATASSSSSSSSSST